MMDANTGLWMYGTPMVKFTMVICFYWREQDLWIEKIASHWKVQHEFDQPVYYVY